MFRQEGDEAFCETWEKFKMMMIKYPNHGFEGIAQLSIFHNDLRSDTKILLNAETSGTMMVVDVEQATKIIDLLTSNDYQA